MGSTPFSARHLVSVICLTSILATLSTSAFKLPQSSSLFKTGQTTGLDNSWSRNNIAFGNISRIANDIEIQFQKSLSEYGKSGVVCVPGQFMFLWLLCSEGHLQDSFECSEFSSSQRDRLDTAENQKQLENLRDLATMKIDGTYAAFADKHLTLNEKFVKDGKDIMDITVNQIDFKEKSKAVKEINSWFAEKTGDLFKEVIKKDDLDSDTKMMFLGALTFKDKWEKPFDPKDTKEDYFHLSKTEKIKVKFMTQTNKFMYSKTYPNEVLILPLKESGLYMFLLLSPDFESEGDRLSGVDLSLMQYDEELVEVTLPKFQLESSEDFKNHYMGFFNNPFDSSANFSRITDLPIKASNIIQNIHLKVDEQGTGATGGSEFDFVHKLSSPNLRAAKQFKVDKPFSFYIRKLSSYDVGVFGGIVRKPQYLE